MPRASPPVAAVVVDRGCCAGVVYAGFPETVYIDSLLAVLSLCWRCGCAPDVSGTRIRDEGGGRLYRRKIIGAPLLVASWITRPMLT